MPLPQVSTSLRDRTPEFIAIAERLQKQQGLSTSGQNGSSSSSVQSQRAQIQQHSEFAKKAAEIGHGIHKTSLKLQTLAQLAKRTSMFNDPSAEIEELTGILQQDIQALNAALTDLQKISARAREDNKQSQDHSSTVVGNLRSRLRDATEDFKEVLTARTENLKHHKERRGLFSANTDAEATVPLLRRPQGAGAALGHTASSSHVPAPSFLQQEQQQVTLAAPQDTYLTNRAENLRNVESAIVEISSMYTKLSDLISQQGELAIRIDTDIDDTLVNVTNAQAQLLKYLNTISSNRWLIMKIFFVLMVFLIIFVVFIV